MLSYNYFLGTVLRVLHVIDKQLCDFGTIIFPICILHIP